MDLTDVLRAYFTRALEGVGEMKVLLVDKETIRIVGTVLR